MDEHGGGRATLAQPAKVLVGGPIQFGMREGRFDETLKVALLTVIERLRRAGWQILSAHLTEDFGESMTAFTPDIVTKRDFGWVIESDVYVAVLPTDPTGVPVFSGGTCIELGWASALRVPILVLWDEWNRENYSHLVRGLHITAPVVYLDLRKSLEDPASLVDTVTTLIGRE
jgi:hypothetical protein